MAAVEPVEKTDSISAGMVMVRPAMSVISRVADASSPASSGCAGSSASWVESWASDVSWVAVSPPVGGEASLCRAQPANRLRTSSAARSSASRLLGFFIGC